MIEKDTPSRIDAYNKLNKHLAFPIVIFEGNNLGQIGVFLQKVKMTFRHFILYTLDLLVSLIFPEARIISRIPLEVFYARKKKFDNHPLINFLVKWDIPCISSTFSALTILKSFKSVSPNINIDYASNLMIHSLKNSYLEKHGAFIDCATKKPDFRSTYYAVCAIRLLEEITPLTKDDICRELKVDRQRICDFLIEQGQNSEYIYKWERIIPNFSILQKSLSSIWYIDTEFFQQYYYVMLENMRSYILEDKGKILGFKLFSNDKTPSISANKSGVLLLNESSTINSNMVIRKETLDIDSIIDTISTMFNLVNKQSIYSNLFDMYNSIFVIDVLNKYYILTESQKISINNIYATIDNEVSSMSKQLEYKGGYLFNNEFYSSPNLYATRLFVEILERRGKLGIINQNKLEKFIFDTYDFQSKQFRNYPYRSWYYFRNLSKSKNLTLRRPPLVKR